MTGFGRCEMEEASRKVTVEIKSVNHRFLDINIKMPKKLNFFESAIRSLLKDYIQRGKVDLFITYEDNNQHKVILKYNEALAAEYIQYIQQMSDTFSLSNELDACKLSRYPEVLTMEEQEIEEAEIWALLKKTLQGAAEAFVETRMKEGAHLKEDMLQKLDCISSYVEEIELRSPQIIADYREKLLLKVQELLKDTQIEEGRLATEVTIFADKICTDEETVRLKSHIQSTKDTLSTEDSIGRKLDFVAQEMNREANTILSKANDMIISDIAINLKTDIEKVREQIQNIE